MKKLITKKSVLAVAAPLLIIGALAFAYFWGEYAKSVPVKDYGHAFLNVNKLYSVMKVNSSMVGVDELLCELDADDKLQIAGSSMKYRGEELNIKLPCFFDSNNYIFIADKEASFISSELRNETIDGRIFYIKNSIYDDEYVKLSDRDDLMLRCTETLFLALKPFEIVGSGETVKVEKYDFLLFDGYTMYKATVWDDSFEHSTHGLYEGSIVKLDGKSYAIGTFLDVLGLQLDGTVKDVIDEEITAQTLEDSMKTIPEATYQYFLGYRYEYPKEMTVHSVDGIWYQDRDGFTSQLDNMPMYYIEEEEEKLNIYDYFNIDIDALNEEEKLMEDIMAGKRGAYLPTEFFYIETYNNSLYKTPAFAKCFHEGEYIYISDGDKKRLIQSGIMYDGDENYFFIEPVTIKFMDKAISVPALSYMSFEGNERISIYDFEKDELTAYVIHTDDIKIELSDKCLVDVVSRKIRLDEGKWLDLGNNPSLYSSYFD